MMKSRVHIAWLTVALSFVCGYVQISRGAAQTSPSAAPPTTLTREKVESAVNQLEQLTQQTLNRTGVPGVAIGVVYNDEVLYLKGFGLREISKSDKIDADTVFEIASVSKPIASTVLAALVGEGTVTWNSRVNDLDPDFEMHDAWVTRQLTLRDLLCHRSGLPDHGGDLLEDLGYDAPAILYRLRFMKPASSFRSAYAYTNFGYSEAAYAAARAANKSWPDLAAEKLYNPLGMKSTSSRYEDYQAAKNQAVIHAHINGKWIAKYTRDATAQAPAGGVSSTVRDMTQWLRLQLADGKYAGKQVIAGDALAETHRPQIVSHAPAEADSDRASFYGLGWNVNYDRQGRVRFNHSGGFDLGAATYVALVPTEHLGVVILTNGAPTGIPEALGAIFCYLALEGHPTNDWFPLYEHAFEEISKPTYGGTIDYNKPPQKK
ncbi:MAG TPA: serine hydrolase domain-containing protein, partial [Pirellulales bacterium]